MWLSGILDPNWSLTTNSCQVFQIIHHYLFTAHPSKTGTCLLFLVSYKCTPCHLASPLSIVVKITKDFSINITVILLWTAQRQVLITFYSIDSEITSSWAFSGSRYFKQSFWHLCSQSLFFSNHPLFLLFILLSCFVPPSKTSRF